MLFEKTLRKKRISPFYAEMIAGLIYNEILMIAFIIFLVVVTWPIEFIWTMVFLSLLLIVFPLAALGDMRPAAKRGFRLMKDRKNKRTVTSDFILLDFDITFASYMFGGNQHPTFTHLVYMEPCLRIAFFKAVSVGTEVNPLPQLRFYPLELHFTYRYKYRYKDECEEMCNEFNQMVDDRDSGKIKMDFGERPMPENVPVSNMCFYLTYEKVNVLNKLFELVDPPEFRVTFYEKSFVLISIDPIPGREYPPEALECMEKINAMYP